MLRLRHVILAATATIVVAATPAAAADIVIGLNTVKSGFMKSIAEATETAVDIAGPAGQVGNGDDWTYQFLRSRANTIEAGTSEVLRNILAERVLGLPRSR